MAATEGGQPATYVPLLLFIFAWVLIVLGCLQWIATPLLFKTADEPAYWFFGGGLTLALVRALNLLRLRYGSIAQGVVVVSVIANVLLALFWVAMAFGLTYKFNRYGAPYVALGLILLNAAISVKNLKSRW